jgi:hypothetical protein
VQTEKMGPEGLPRIVEVQDSAGGAPRKVLEVQLVPGASSEEMWRQVERAYSSCVAKEANTTTTEKDMEWQAPKNPAKRKKTDEPPPAASTSNKYAGLPEVSEGGRTPNKKRPSRIPPVIMKVGEMTHLQIVALVKSFCKSSMTMTYISGGRASVKTSTSQDREALLKGLREKDHQFHTFSTAEEKMKKTVIRGLPALDEKDILEDIKEQGLDVQKVVRMTTKGSNAIYIAYFGAQQQMGVVKDTLRVICCCRVKLDRYRPRGAAAGTQCFRCQSFGHAARNCNNLARCVKCKEQHATSDCPKKTREEPADCCNCGGQHPANYRQCPRRQQYVASVSARTRRPQTQTRSWSEVVRGPALLPTPAQPARPQPQEKPAAPAPAPRTTTTAPPRRAQPQERAESSTSELVSLLRLVMAIKPRLARCETSLDKALVIVEFLESLE